jgi:hypothetical protein
MPVIGFGYRWSLLRRQSDNFRSNRQDNRSACGPKFLRNAHGRPAGSAINVCSKKLVVVGRESGLWDE